MWWMKVRMTVSRQTWRVANGVSLLGWTFSSQTRDEYCP